MSWHISMNWNRKERITKKSLDKELKRLNERLHYHEEYVKKVATFYEGHGITPVPDAVMAIADHLNIRFNCRDKWYAEVKEDDNV